MIVTTTPSIEGRTISDYRGIVIGEHPGSRYTVEEASICDMKCAESRG